MVVRVCIGAIDAIKSAAALSLIPLPLRAALRWKGVHSRNHPTAKFAKRWLFFKCQRFHRSTCSTQESGGSSACNRKARCKKVVLGFPAKPCKADTTGTPRALPTGARHRTSLNRVNCTNANTYHVSTSGIIPPYKKPESKGRLRSPLARLSPHSFVVQRKNGSPKGPEVSKRTSLVNT